VEPLPAHIIGFRELYAPDPVEHSSIVKAMWRSLLPGLAQLWYRFVVLWAKTWPTRLLLFLVEGMAESFYRELALDLLVHSCDDCCFGQGGSIALDLKKLAEQFCDDLEGQINFLRGPWCSKVIWTYAISISITIHDIESGNANIKLGDSGGRPANVGTVAAKGIIRDALSGFFATHSKYPKDNFKETAKELIADFADADKKIKRKRAPCAYDAFRKEFCRSRKESACPLPMPKGERGKLGTLLSDADVSHDVGVAYHGLSAESFLGYAMDSAMPAVLDAAGTAIGATAPLSESITHYMPAHEFQHLRCYDMEPVIGDRLITLEASEMFKKPNPKALNAFAFGCLAKLMCLRFRIRNAGGERCTRAFTNF
jgi:hypothetical protein